MQALMLAAGMGRRMGKHTENHTKCMITVDGKTLLLRAVEALKKADIRKLILVVGYKADVLEEYVKNTPDFDDMEIEYIHNVDYSTTNNIYSLFMAKDLLIQDDTILLESDLIFDDTLIKNLIADPRKNLVVASKYEQWMDGTVIEINDKDNVIDFIEKDKFRYEDVDKYYKTVNIYKFSKEFSEKQYVPFLHAYLSAYGTNQYYEQVLKIFAHIKSSELEAFRLNNTKWYEIDDAQDLDIAETMFANDDKILSMYEYHFGGYWRFPHVVDFCYLVNPYYPPKKMVSQIKYSFDQLLTQYPSGMSIQRLNAESMFDVNKEYLTVGNGAAELINILGKYIHGKMSLFIPSFNEYCRCFTNCTINKIHADQYDYRYNIDAILNVIDDTDVLVLINPDNPSGGFIEKEDMLRIIEKCENKSVRIIVDESFIDFAERERRYTLLENSILEKYKQLIVIKSISKSYGVPGLRLGVMASSDENVNDFVYRNMAIWNINSFAEYFLQIQRLYKRSYNSACDQIVERRNELSNELAQIPFLTVYPSQANYIMCELDESCGYNSKQLAVELIKNYGLLVKNLSGKEGFNSKSFLRFAVKDEEDNKRLVDALKSVIEA